MIAAHVILLRQQLSGLAWTYGRWVDGRRVIIHNSLGEVAITEPSPLTNEEFGLPHVSMYRREYTWEEVAKILLGDEPVFGSE